ncbi:hypothetical protein, partial [Pseudovibrio exalbescens]|uniref:hypothetical protein n=1 Tax=Pseudovibrio exalbescens TaxID=197461 RepID=UPI001AD8CF50
ALPTRPALSSLLSDVIPRLTRDPVGWRQHSPGLVALDAGSARCLSGMTRAVVGAWPALLPAARHYPTSYALAGALPT